MSETPFQIVLVGCGAVSQILYAPALQALEASGEARVSGLVDPAAAPRAELLKCFPAAARPPGAEAARGACCRGGGETVW